MKLYAVHYADYGDDGVVAIYDTREAAEVLLKRLDKPKANYCYFIREYTLNQESKE